MNLKSPWTYLLVFAVVFAASFLYMKSNQSSKLDVDDIEDFDAFYEKFMTDSTFQMSRINFPLQGWSSNADSLTLADGFYWQKSDWNIHKKTNYEEGGYKQDLLKSDVLVKETLYMKGVNIGYERRFMVDTNGKWFLIFLQKAFR